MNTGNYQIINKRNYTDYIESNAGIMLGKPVIKGTQISVALILKKMSEGATIQDIITAYPDFTEKAVNAVLAYASDVTGNETIIAVA